MQSTTQCSKKILLNTHTLSSKNQNSLLIAPFLKILVYIYMERRKHRGSNLDELAIVKAAAWAWYQNGSGAEGKSTREYDLSRTHQYQTTPKPSRYKLEAMNTKKVHHHHHHHHHQEEQKDPIIPNQILPSSPSSLPLICPLSSNNEKSLFDTYEIERISRELHSYMESSRIEHLMKSFGNRTAAGYKKFVSLLSEESSSSSNSNSNSKPTKKHSSNNNKTLIKGFWPVICGGSGRGDVVEARESGRRISFGRSNSSRQQRQWNEKKNVAVVKTSSSHRRGAGVHSLQ